jgi:hypothetical protein
MSEKNDNRRQSNRYEGMTTNERLYEAGLLQTFNAAAFSKDRTKMMELLIAVAIKRADAERIIGLELENK